ncbi:transglycosylase domain-containing protein [Haematobacter genomosp. 1]|uniref:peptidoglycan glycosyltransferase n=1 Tax=Haematobacter genomosp. 1 TaxID=366618 RepID=A0A212A7M3_9RHOB|nr:transglycosylase domain-containing protein [Haematobacter genomosp. 1]OWJ75553.1 glycosyl transferase [Haematobacter genomosp. 1]
MSNNGRTRPPLVADRRYPTGKAAGKPQPRKAAPAKPPAKARRKTSSRRRGTGGSALRRIPVIGFFVALFSGLFRLSLRVVWGAAWRLGMVGALILGGAIFYFYSQLPDVTALLDGRNRGSVTMLDKDGRPFAWRGETFGGEISAEHISPNLRNAVIATEDKRFYSHFGISPRGILSAVAINIQAGRGPFEGNGGSTITQQVAKLLCLGVPYDPKTWKNEAEYEADCRVSSLVRKIKEVPYSMAMEAKYTKDEILTIYISRAYLGAGTRGFEAAAQRYFGKSAAEVTPAEAAMLAGLLKAPSYYAPTNNLSRSQERANVIIGLMAEQGYLTAKQAQQAQAQPARLSDSAAQQAGGYFADWVMESGPSFLTTQTMEDVVIRTTLDPRLQRAAESALTDVFGTKVKEGSTAQAAIVVMSADGAVRAMVGGRKSQVSGAFNRATQALRQTGSSFKPFIYATALNQGAHYNDYVVDEPLTINVPGSGPWSPQNYTRGEYKGRVTLTQALKLSLNIPAVKISEGMGRDNVRRTAEAFGIRSDIAAGPAMALGTSEATLLEMTGAYAGLLNGGSHVTPYGLVDLTLRGDSSPLIGQTGGIGNRVISEQASRELIYMMNQVIESGTGTRARLPGREAAGKTGTTSAARDAWFIGFTADYVAGVWMGYDDNRPLSGVTGGGLPAEIWREVMLRVHEGLPARQLPMIVPAPEPPPQVAEERREQQRPGNRVDDFIGNILQSILGN